MKRKYYPRCLICMMAVLLTADVYAQDEAVRDPLALQAARTNRVKERGEKRFYTKQFDLSGLPEYVPAQKIQGKLRIAGLNYLGDCGLSTAWADGFRKYHPEVVIEYYLPTALVAVPNLINHTADLGATRPVSFDERLTFQRIFNGNPVEIKMVTGSYDVPGYATTMTVIVNPANPITRLDIGQLDGIFGAARTGGYHGIEWDTRSARGADKNIRKWGQLGLTGEWADRRITVHNVTLRFHYPPVFEELVFQGGDKWNEDMKEYNNYMKADGSGWFSHGQQIPAEVGKDPAAIGLTWMAYLAGTNTRALAIAPRGSSNYAEMTIDNVQNGSYPLAYNEYWIFPRKAGDPVDPKIKEFLRYTLSREGQQAVNDTGKFLPLTAAVVREELKKLE